MRSFSELEGELLLDPSELQRKEVVVSSSAPLRPNLSIDRDSLDFELFHLVLVIVKLLLELDLFLGKHFEKRFSFLF